VGGLLLAEHGGKGRGKDRGQLLEVWVMSGAMARNPVFKNEITVGRWTIKDDIYVVLGNLRVDFGT
jgi:hypothetical protein